MPKFSDPPKYYDAKGTLIDLSKKYLHILTYTADNSDGVMNRRGEICVVNHNPEKLSLETWIEYLKVGVVQSGHIDGIKLLGTIIPKDSDESDPLPIEGPISYGLKDKEYIYVYFGAQVNNTFSTGFYPHNYYRFPEQLNSNTFNVENGWNEYKPILLSTN